MTSSSSRAPDGRRVQVQWPGSRAMPSSATDQPGSIRTTRCRAMSVDFTTPGLTSEEASGNASRIAFSAATARSTSSPEAASILSASSCN